MRARLIAHYLPQFHPVPENDACWGRGFTEWTLVARARPLFAGHQQPKLPADLGFYDLRVPETRAAQAEMAEAHGISAFCWWTYWLGGGRRMLERPFREVLESGEPRLPFCVGWANHPWTDAWRGNASRVFVEQTYPGPVDYHLFFDAMLPYFRDDRYFRVDGKPLFLIYRIDDLPDPYVFNEIFRQRAHEAGLGGLYMVAYKPNRRRAGIYDLDAAVWAMPNSLPSLLPRTPPIYDFGEVAYLLPGPADMHATDHPSIVTGWDNSPRWGAASTILTGYTPTVFRTHVRDVLDRVAAQPLERRLVFVKSWNEWSEGNYLEPDDVHGMGFLEALRDEVVG